MNRQIMTSWFFIYCQISLIILLEFQYTTVYVNSVKYAPCVSEVSSESKETRRLFVATCDTRSGWKEFVSLKMWNTTGHNLRNDGVVMKNVCTGKNWGANGYLTKPLIYMDFVKSLNILSTEQSPIYVILMDSDTFWAVDNVQAIWKKFDCARGKKEVVLSTEMSCWVGRYCKKEDLDRWYNSSFIKQTPSYSPFANSGVVIGSTSKVLKMLEYVVANNKSYYIKYTNKLKFDDQYAIADYALNIAPQDIALDYHQQLLASFSIHTPNSPPDEPGWPFVCKNQTGQLDTSCPNWTKKLMRMGHFKLDSPTCQLRRHYFNSMPCGEELESLAPDPIIWHGNGAGKELFVRFGHDAFKCEMKRRNMTEQDHINTYG